MLGMYQAELARVLGLQCADIGAMASVQKFLEPDSPSWSKAELFIQFYQKLFQRFNGDEVLMVHWLRADLKKFNKSPLLMMVDDGELSVMFDYLCNHSMT